MTDEIDVGRFKDLLLAARAEVRDLLEGDEERAKIVELDQTSVGRLSRMDALQSQAMAQAGQRRRRVDLQRIEAALERIEEDEYGYCTQCGELIPEARLLLDPAAATCVAHAK